MLVYEAESPDPSEVGRARRALREWLTSAGVRPDDTGDVMIVMSELVTNAVRHAGTAFELRCELEDHVVRIEVFDRDTRPPVLVGADAAATGGRGMVIIADLAEQWGVQTDEHDGVEGKVVWAEVRLAPLE